MGELLKLADATDDVRFDSVLDCVNNLKERIEKGYASDPDFRPTSIVCILVDQTEGQYSIKRHCSSMKTSEVIALLEVTKHQELRLLEPALGDL